MPKPSGKLTPHQRFRRCMLYEPTDRPVLWEWTPWPSTLRRWQREALGEGNQPPQYEECENKVLPGVDMWMLPRFEEKVLQEDEEYVTRTTDRGGVVRLPKSPDTMSMPEHLEYPVKGRKDWESLKERFNPDDPARFPDDWHERCERWRREEPILVFQGPRSPSLFGFVRELMGPERALCAFYDNPELVHEMMEFITEFLLGVMDRTLEEAPITAIFFWEDMAYKAGPLISPGTMREFMVPRYRRMTDLAVQKGIELSFVDSDGDVTELIPLWQEAGIRGVYPMEVAAGMDVSALRQQFGQDLLMTGGFDKRALARNRDAIDREFKRRIPLVEEGGYIPHIDHAIPHDVPYENFAYYWRRKKDLLGIA